jgi:hypothetical protein
MVLWSHVVEAWKSKAVALPSISVFEERGTVDFFKFPPISDDLVPASKPVVKSDLSPPPVVKNTVQFQPAAIKPVAIKPVAIKPVAAPVTKDSFVPKPLEHKRPSESKDPISIGMNLRDPLYCMASTIVKQRMECEEAQRLESVMRSIYQSQGGRARGWTLSGLETYLKPRCASGGDILALKRSKCPFDWNQVLEDKNTSAFLDFICVAQRIRVAVWSDADKSVTVFPAADSSEETSTTPIPLFHVYSNGSVKSDPMDSKALVTLCASMGYAYLPPPSVMKSLAHLNVEDLQSLADKLGLTDLTGSKAQRVVSIAVWKLKQRLLQ